MPTVFHRIAVVDAVGRRLTGASDRLERQPAYGS
jgi:hypothetical protein